MRAWFSILVVGALMSAGSALAQDEAPEGLVESVVSADFVSIFNGEDLTGWSGDEELWKVENGTIVGETTAEALVPYNKFLIWNDGEVDDFELKLEYRCISGNSGIQVRSRLNSDPNKTFSVLGYQADLDAGRAWAGTNYGEGFGGILAKRGQSVVMRGKDDADVEEIGDIEELKEAIHSGEEWNSYHIIAQKNRIEQRINGELMSVFVDERPEARRSGVLAFQLHQGAPMRVEFRNVQLKRLPLEDRKKVVFIAGSPSHRAGDHEHNAGCLLLSRLVNESMGEEIISTVYNNGWPADSTAIQNADAIVIYSDGSRRHPGMWHRKQVNILRDQGVGVGCIHFAVEMLPDESNQDLISWIGGAFEVNYSVNPHWDAEFTSLPDHPVANGVNPFTVNDEWYFNMRFADSGVTPILSAIPPDSTMDRKDGAHSGNPTVRKMVADKLPQHVCWVYERENGGRGFGFTGGHRHSNWQHDDFRKTALNAIAWIAGVDVPENGVQTETPTDDEMTANLDPGKRQ